MERTVEKKQLYHQQVYDFLKSDILTGRLRPGDRINENPISQEFGVSRSPVREAIRMLEQEELVIMRAGRAVVNPMSPEMLLELYECRLVMEPYAVRITLPYYTEEDIATLRDFAEKSREAFAQEEFESVVHFNTVFHERLISRCQNNRLKKTIQRYQELSILARHQEFYLFHRDKGFITEHESVIQAIMQGDADQVEAAMCSHLQNDLEFYRKNIKV